MNQAHDDQTQPTDYRLPSRQGKVVMPISENLMPSDANPAAEVIRQKISQLYASEPAAKEEQKEVEHIRNRSRHQQYMYELSHSGKSLAQIQTEWHNYYLGLSDQDKHTVWQEFYAAHSQVNQQNITVNPPSPVVTTAKEVKRKPKSRPKQPDKRSVADIKQQLLTSVQGRVGSQKKPHLQSLLFGLGMGSLVLLIMLFGFFNERFIAPFITPSRAVSSTPLIIDPSTTAVGLEPKIVIPKINVEIPVVYDEPSIAEQAVQNALERGVVHYATTPNPGELGNGVIFGHSANNILNKGKYKFAFVLLRKLELGDTFYLQKDGKRYVYRVFEKKIVPPSEVSVLNNTSKPASFTLITCDPPGTSLNRLVVVGDQISPDPSTNVASSVNQETSAQPAELPSNSPTLWDRLSNSLSR